MKQQSFASAAWENKGRKTRRELFLQEMDQVVPWAELTKLIEPYYPKGEEGHPPKGLEGMLRIHFMQLWFNQSDPGMEDLIYESESVRRFADIELGGKEMPDETTILRFRHLLEEHDLAKKLFDRVGRYLERRGLLVRSGTIVDATLIAAPPSTKNRKHQRDPDMTQSKKGQQWCVSRTQAADLWCCTRDGSRSPGASLQEQASNRPMLRRSKGAVVSERVKVIP